MNKKETDVRESIYTEEGEITFKGLFGFLKRGWLRLVIYLIAALLVVTAVYGGVKFFGRSDYGVSAKIGFSFKEMTAGHNPDGTNFDKEVIRSTEYVRKAAESTGLSDKILKGGNDIGEVRSRIAVEAVTSQEYLQQFASLVAGGASETDAALRLSQLNYKPTEFVVSFNNYEQLGLDKKEAMMFLDGLIAAYGNGYHETYFAKIVLDESVFTMESDLYDYLDYAELCETSYEKINDYLDAMSSEASDFKSSQGKKFETFKNELVFLQGRLMSFKAFVVDANVSKDIENLKIATQTAIANLDAEKNRLTEIIASVKDTLANIKPSTVTTFPGGGADAVITVTYPESYYALQEKLISYQEQLADASAQLKKKNDIKTALESGKTPQDSDFVTADSLIAQIKKTSEMFVEDVNAVAKEYADKEIASSGMKVVVPTVYVSVSPAFPTMLAYLCGVMIAVVAAVIVTYALGKRGKVKAEAKKKASETESKEE